MNLDISFNIASGLLILCLLPLYIYRKQILKKFTKSDSFHLFVNDVKSYMSKYHPKIQIDYSIIEKIKIEENTIIRENIIVENILQQFFDYPYKKKTQKSIPKEKLWATYIEKSISNQKYPNDWAQRKEFAWKRDNKSCNRCAKILTLDNTFSTFAKDIKDGGGYNFENIIILCSDCNKILNSTNPKSTISSLILNDKLMSFVEHSQNKI